jgi:poly(3-hydroxybutyrate) depolymerase
VRPDTLPGDWAKGDLSKADAKKAIELLWTDHCRRLAKQRAGEIEAKSIQLGDKKLRYLEKVFGDAPEGGRSLWISMHGGGGAPTQVNDSQWKNQIKLYQPAEGIYVAPRAPTDTWNLWHQFHIDGLFDRLIENYVATRGVNPNRVYLMGYSAGGDGVYQLAPRMADRWAAASMMAGHPNDAKPDNLRNIGFGLFMGGKDGAYKRNQVAGKWKGMLADLRKGDPKGYEHMVRIYPEMGHWMKGKDVESLPWMAKFTRNPWPSKIIWRQAKGITSRFYWLQIPEKHLANGQRLAAEVDGQAITITAENTKRLVVRLSDQFVNLDEPVSITVNGEEKFNGKVKRSVREIIKSLGQRGDPSSVAMASVKVNL